MTRNYKIYIVNYIVFLIFCLASSMIDSQSWIPYIVAVLCMIYCLLFALANRDYLFGG